MPPRPFDQHVGAFTGPKYGALRDVPDDRRQLRLVDEHVLGNVCSGVAENVPAPSGCSIRQETSGPVDSCGDRPADLRARCAIMFARSAASALRVAASVDNLSRRSERQDNTPAPDATASATQPGISPQFIVSPSDFSLPAAAQLTLIRHK